MADNVPNAVALPLREGAGGRGPSAAILPGDRLHLQHGPIDLVIGVAGTHRDTAYAAAQARFATILKELCAELPLLRGPAGSATTLQGVVARRMLAAVTPHTGFITPMAAVAGAVADEILAAMTRAAPLRRAYVNNGGDIAFHLAPGESLRLGLVDRPDRPSLFATATLRHGEPIAGVATSGWRGRSFSLGIADAITVLAASAAAADAAATVIANAVDLPGHPAITRAPAAELQPDSDLGDRLVTRAVGALSRDDIVAALAAGQAAARRLLRAGLIATAALHCQGETQIVGGAAVTQREQPVHA